MPRIGEDTLEAHLRASAKDPRRFDSVFDLTAERLLRRFARAVFDADAAADLMAETLAQAFIARRRFRGAEPGQGWAWIDAIGEAQLSRYFRRQGVEQRAMTKLKLERLELTDEDRLEVEQDADLPTARLRLAQELGRLSPEQRDAVELRVVEGQRYRQIAEQLGITEEAARARVARGLKQLSGRLALDRQGRSLETSNEIGRTA